jgi:hypothetical protein
MNRRRADTEIAPSGKSQMTKSYVRLLKISCLLGLVLPVAVVACSQNVWDQFSDTILAILLLSAVAIPLLYMLLRRLLRALDPAIENACRQQAEFLENMQGGRIDWAIFSSAAVSLVLELAVIRWQSTLFPVFALYKNYTLLASFAGLGLGYALAKRESIPLVFTIPVLGCQMLLLTAMRYAPLDLFSAFWGQPFTEQLSLWVWWGPGLSRSKILLYFLFIAVFLFTTLAFIPIGQLCGRLMTRRNRLKAYGLNLAGSIAGVVLMSGISYFWTPPAIWFGVSFAVLLAFLAFDRRVLLAGMVSALAALAVLQWPVCPGVERIYSPYQILECSAGQGKLMVIRAAGHFYQQVFDLSVSNANRSADETLRRTANYYEVPYRIYGKPIEDVVVVGAGTGNDVAAALRCGARHVDAVDIDPAIIHLGRLYHPEQPYQDPKVSAVVEDARTFIRRTEKRHDMIVYGLLDSHSLLSHASSVRLDSFVYTVEALREAREKLKPDGMLSLSFYVLSDEIGCKFYRMMQDAFDGRPPVCIQDNYAGGDTGTIIFLQSRGGDLSPDPKTVHESGFTDITARYASLEKSVDVSTDDWPFPYMPRRVYPFSYLIFFAVMLIMFALIVYNFMREKPVLGSIGFFFLGAGFMLVETKAITEMGLALGNTWQVIGIAIAGILFMAFMGNWAVQRLHVSRPFLPLIMVLVSLLIGFVVSKNGGFDSSIGGKLATIALLTCPMFFSGIVFSSLLGQSEEISGAMAVNLMGAMTGGILEYNSMYFGFGFLYLLAMALYALAMVAIFIGARTRRAANGSAR